MYEFYCEECKRKCNSDEVELRQSGWFGEDFEEYHIYCDKTVSKSLNLFFDLMK